MGNNVNFYKDGMEIIFTDFKNLSIYQYNKSIDDMEYLFTIPLKGYTGIINKKEIK